MVNSNIYKSKILPSKKAFAYKMKLDAINHQGKKRHFYTRYAEIIELIAKVSVESIE